jgi:gluconokinase
MPNAPTPAVLALDVGSSSARALLFDTAGQPIPDRSAQIAYSVLTTPDGGAELDMDQLAAWVEQCIDTVLAGMDARLEIRAVACSTLVGNLLGVDAAGRPSTPLWIWADTRAAAAARELRAAGLEGSWQRTGAPLHSAYWPARLRWLAAEHPELLAQTSRWLTLGEYLTERWLGRPLLSLSVAAWNGLLDRSSQTWDAALLEQLPIRRDQLGTPQADLQPHVGLSPDYDRRWPALRTAAWLAPIGDGLGSSWGVGAVQPDRVAINLGTSGAMRVLLPAGGPLPPGLWSYRVDGRSELVGGALSNGGNLIDWATDSLKLPTLAELEDDLAALPPAGHGLTVLPFWAGQRAPDYDDDARAVIHGLTLSSSPMHILQAMMEAVAYSFGQIYACLLPLLPAEHTIIAGGGALEHSPAWGRMICDVLGRPLRLSSVAEATARGTALYAIQALGLGAAPETAPTRLCRPDPARHERYAQASAAMLDLQRRLAAP